MSIIIASIILSVLSLSCKNQSTKEKPDLSISAYSESKDSTRKKTGKDHNGAYGSKMIIDGFYEGKNLFVQNPASGLDGFCVTLKPMVNGSISTAVVKSSAFEIKLDEYSLKKGDRVYIEITHDINCTPKILNPEVIDPEK